MERPLQDLLKDPDTLKELEEDPATFRFRNGASFVITMQTWPPQMVMRPEDFNTDIGMDGVPTKFPISGPIVNVLNILAKSLNFTYLQVRPPDGSWGSKLENGTWTGMVGQVVRKEVDMALGPFGILYSRFQATDMSIPIHFDKLHIMAARGSPKFNPWGFLMPLTSEVWTALLLSLLGVSVIHMLLGLFKINSSSGDWSGRYSSIFFRYIQPPLNQALPQKKISTEWDRVMLATWAIGSLLVTWSYSGTLISHMALRHIPHPIKTLRDLVDDTSVKIILEQNTAYTETIRIVEYGDIKDLNDLQYKGRFVYRRFRNFPEYLPLIRDENHAHIFDRTSINKIMGHDFSQTGQCDFYKAKEAFLPFMYTVINRKDSPLTPALNARLYRIFESGLYFYWVTNAVANSTACDNPPTTVTFEEPLDLENIWGVAVVWGTGLLISSTSFFFEMLIGKICKTHEE